MNKLSKNEKGFSAVEILLVILILVVIGGVGYMVYHNNHKTNASTETTASLTKSNSTLPHSTIMAGPKSNWKTYTNNSLGFSFAFPDTSVNPSGCSESDNYDNDNGGTITGPETYRTSSGQVPNTVINLTNTYYVAPTYTYMLTGGTTPTIDGTNGYDVFSACVKVSDTPSLITQQLDDASQVNGPTNLSFSTFSMKANVVKQGSPLDTAVQSILGDKTLEVTGLTPNTHGGGGDTIKFTCSQQPCGNIGGSYSLLYYPSKDLLTFWNIGQSCNLFANTSTNSNSACYDSSVIDSFKLTD